VTVTVPVFAVIEFARIMTEPPPPPPPPNVPVVELAFEDEPDPPSSLPAPPGADA
jgi:hypothetical protein